MAPAQLDLRDVFWHYDPLWTRPAARVARSEIGGPVSKGSGPSGFWWSMTAIYPHDDTPSTQLRPITVLVFSFIGLIGVGAGLLALPEAALQRLSFIDALFTATSAVCVTGLSVVDTGTDLTPFGQGVLLALIQLGGLGIMTFSTFILLLMGRRLSFRTHTIIAETHLGRSEFRPRRVLGLILALTLGLEGAGFILLMFQLAAYMPWGQAVWWAAFHSVSAFCNAGFSLSDISLVAFQADWGVNLTIMALIILGGLGFVVLSEVITRWGGRKTKPRPPLSLHSRMVLVTTGLLIFGGAAYLLVVETFDSLAGYGWGERILISLFQSVTARTAGFNTIDLASFSNASIIIVMLLMFIGASPASCGGGIKTTTLATLYAMIRARLKGEATERLFKRSLPRDAVNRALTLAAGSIMVVALFSIVVFSLMPETNDRGQFVAVLFEVFSAFGTVGLSLGATDTLTPAAKLVMVALMLIGRLGPLTMVRFLSSDTGPEKYRYAEEPYLVG